MAAWLPRECFASFSNALFSFKFIVFISIVGFSNEGNCCQSQGIAKSIQEKLVKGIFKVD